MEDQNYFALVVSGNAGEGFRRTVCRQRIGDLPAGEILVRVHYSSLNYKDALSATGNRGVTRRYPHTPGIDAAGIVVASHSSSFRSGDPVVCMGHDLGMNTAGGFGQFIRVPADWVLPLPEPLTLLESMRIGTAGFTAAQCVHRLLAHGLEPDSGPVLVTGATGGVGSFAVALLARLGYRVVAVTGKKSEHAFLGQLGAAEVIDRARAATGGARMMLRERWAGVVDTVGGEILAAAVKACRYGGMVTCCGNAASGDLPLSVYPFILRAVTLAGIDSASCPMARRRQIWDLLAGEWRLDMLERLSRVIDLAGLDDAISAMLAGAVRGRIVINMQEDP
ncbi:YhdH/YhfP family quinone oxidoreductase [Thermodesulfobacteriota bacterium B35]